MAIDQGARDEIMLIVGTLPAMADALAVVAQRGSENDEKIIDILDKMSKTYGEAIITLSKRLASVERDRDRLLRLLEIAL